MPDTMPVAEALLCFAVLCAAGGAAPSGLLEDVSLFSQLLVSRIFELLRWLVGCVTFVGSSGGMTPGQQQQQLATVHRVAAAAVVMVVVMAEVCWVLSVAGWPGLGVVPGLTWRLSLPVLMPMAAAGGAGVMAAAVRAMEAAGG